MIAVKQRASKPATKIGGGWRMLRFGKLDPKWRPSSRTGPWSVPVQIEDGDLHGFGIESDDDLVRRARLERRL